ncbi:hypothetical protein AURDEDRAFT_111841 [Auricularia subglabra TFB-10046 SS5]|nr:hypothetical protein AURDEDRAFT_111841 [Auricularia subglabra TFB-10046 SS5]
MRPVFQRDHVKFSPSAVRGGASRAVTPITAIPEAGANLKQRHEPRPYNRLDDAGCPALTAPTMSLFNMIGHRAREHAHIIHQRVNSLGRRKDTAGSTASTDLPAYAYDLAFRFIGASGLPAMDFAALSDPYFVASIDGKIEYKSSVQPNTLTPVWNEQWFVKNVPETATLELKVYDKDDGTTTDDFIGSFQIPIEDGLRECKIVASSKAEKGTMFFEIKTTPTRTPDTALYTFDGPVNFSRHSSVALGKFAGVRDSGLGDKTAFLAALPEGSAPADQTSPMPPASAAQPMTSVERMRRHVYSTWKFHLKGVPLFFGDEHQHWLVDYPAARAIFTGSPVVRSGIRSAHRILYARSTVNDFGVVSDANDLWRQLSPQERQPAVATEPRLTSNPISVATKASSSWLVKPVLYTYVIDEGERFRFSETGAAFFTDFASKHALHACVSETVRYAGEFHARPVVEGGWAGLNGHLPPEDAEWELWIDNASGTYGPDPKLLPNLKGLLEYNFPGIQVRVFDYKDEELAQSKKDMHDYAQNKPNLLRTGSELQDAVGTADAEQGVAAATSA